MRKEERNRWVVPPALKASMTEVARGFRKAPTPSEAILWRALRGEVLDGRKFRRQQPIGPFIVDFYCSTERLIVEVDGGVHESQREREPRGKHCWSPWTSASFACPPTWSRPTCPPRSARYAGHSRAVLPSSTPPPLWGRGRGRGGTEAA